MDPPLEPCIYLKVIQQLLLHSWLLKLGFRNNHILRVIQNVTIESKILVRKGSKVEGIKKQVTFPEGVCVSIPLFHSINMCVTTRNSNSGVGDHVYLHYISISIDLVPWRLGDSRF